MPLPAALSPPGIRRTGFSCGLPRRITKSPASRDRTYRFLIIKPEVVMSNAALAGVAPGATYVASFEQLRMTDVESVGGKNASLGEMISQLANAGVRVPGGFATTAQAFRDFLSHGVNGGPPLAQRIADRLESLNIDDVRALAEAGA